MAKFKIAFGIIGGIGPAATAFALTRLIEICQSDHHSVQDTDFPRVYVANVPIKGIDETGLSAEPHPGAVTDSLSQSYNLFSIAGVSAVYLSCNTLQIHRPDPALHGMKEINPIESGMAFVSEYFSGEAKVAVISSQYTRDYGLYENSNGGNGLTFLEIDEETQRIVDQLILQAMGGHDLQVASDELNQLCESLLSECDVVVLGCTELSLLANQKIPLANGVLDSQEVALRELLDLGR